MPSGIGRHHLEITRVRGCVDVANHEFAELRVAAEERLGLREKIPTMRKRVSHELRITVRHRAIVAVAKPREGAMETAPVSKVRSVDFAKHGLALRTWIRTSREPRV